MSILSHLIVACLTRVAYHAFSSDRRLWLLTGLLASAVAGSAYAFKKHAGKESYDLDHALLNTSAPRTMWLNMGYWKDTKVFVEACEALATRLAEFADIQKGDRILDIGYGCGESVVLWEKLYKPSKIVGVTSMVEHCELAKAALRRVEDLSLDSDVDLQVGDAVAWTRSAADSGRMVFDRVIALDCVYHFKPRKAFLENALYLLDPIGGTLGMTDLLLPSEPLTFFSRIALQLVCWLAKVPFDNLVSRDEYEAGLRELGYIDIDIDDITPHVFHGLAGYIESMGRDHLLATALDKAKLSQYRAFARVLRWWGRGNLRFVLVKARRAFVKSGPQAAKKR